MSPVRESARLTAGEVSCTAPGDPGVRVERPGTFVLGRDYLGDRPVYFRVDHDTVEWADNPAVFLDASAPPPPDVGMLLALIHGTVPDPTASPVPGVQRLAAGTVVRLDASGVTVVRHQPSLPDSAVPLRRAVRNALPADCSIAYSGGLSSAFAAVCALEAGYRPRLLHADFGQDVPVPVAEIPGLTITRVRTDIADLLDPHQITGAEACPPLPDTEVPRRLVARLGAHSEGPVVVGSFLEDLVSVRLPDIPKGIRDWRLLTCEPFHTAGRLRGLGEARKLIGRGGVDPAGRGAETAAPAGAGPLPGVTEPGRHACAAAQRGMLALWKSRLDLVDPVIGRVEGGLAERGSGDATVPAADPVVLAAAAALPAGKVGRIRRGVLENHLPLQRAVDRHRIVGLHRRPPGQWLRLAAADYLYRERDKIAGQLRQDCALGDLGAVDPVTVARILDDGRDLAVHALVVLRLVWVEQWLRGRS